MAKERIFIVEDERIVAEDLKRMLERLGYEVAGTAASGEEAIKKVAAAQPALVLMDIRIQGPMDGVEVAEHLYTHFDIPVSYLTAYADETTLDRAKATMPFGYILKPFEERHLQTTIEMALFRHKMDRMLKKLDQWHAAALQNLSEAVVAADEEGRVRFLNKTAEALTGLALENVFGKPIEQIFQFQKNGGEPVLFIDRGAQKVPLHYARTPVKDQEGFPRGSVLVLKEA